jgi:hypothetical protein
MSWHDLTNTNAEEPEEDRALRGELREMLGLAPQVPSVPPDAAASADLAALARSLHGEAVRRKRARPGAHSGWPRKLGRTITASISMAAAALVVASIATAALVAWSSRLGRREEALAARTAELDARQSRLVEAKEAMKAAGAKEGKEGKERDAAQPMLQAAQSEDKPGDKKGKGDGKGEKGELIKPEEAPARLDSANERRLVKDSR